MEHKGHTVISSRQCRSFSTVFCTASHRALAPCRNADLWDGFSEGIPVPQAGTAAGQSSVRARGRDRLVVGAPRVAGLFSGREV